MSDIIKDFELLRCPFCGGKAIMESWDMVPYEKLNIQNANGKWYAVFCNDCLSQGNDYITASDAADAWNKRIQG